MEICGLRTSTNVPDGKFEKWTDHFAKFFGSNGMCFVRQDLEKNAQISLDMTAKEWRVFAAEILEALRVFGLEDSNDTADGGRVQDADGAGEPERRYSKKQVREPENGG